jgi:hypothetical protein
MRAHAKRTWPGGLDRRTSGYAAVMYIGLGTVVLILVILLIVYMVRRA